MIEKTPPLRDPKYLVWVRQQRSVISKAQPCEAHHPIGERYSQQKCSDYLAFPLTTAEHAELHRDWPAWEAKHGPQLAHSARTMNRAIADKFPFPAAAAEPRKQPQQKSGSSLSSSKCLPRRL